MVTMGGVDGLSSLFLVELMERDWDQLVLEMDRLWIFGIEDFFVLVISMAYADFVLH